MLQRPDEIAEDLEQKRKKMERTEDMRKQREHRRREKREERREWNELACFKRLYYIVDFSNIRGFVRLGTSGEKRSAEKRKEKERDELEDRKGKWEQEEKRAGMIRVLVHNTAASVKQLRSVRVIFRVIFRVILSNFE